MNEKEVKSKEYKFEVSSSRVPYTIKVPVSVRREIEEIVSKVENKELIEELIFEVKISLKKIKLGRWIEI